MTSFCITGNAQSSLVTFAKLISAAGVSPAGTSGEPDGLSFSRWHDEATLLLSHPAPDSKKPVALQKIWKTRAIKLLQRQDGVPSWFWTDLKSVRFLDFWSRLDDDIKFIFLYETPQALLISLMEKKETNYRQLTIALDEWCRLTRGILRFHTSRPHKSILVRSDLVTEDLCAAPQNWGLSKIRVREKLTRTTISALENYLVNEVIASHSEAPGLAELAATHLNSNQSTLPPPTTDQLAQAINLYIQNKNSKMRTGILDQGKSNFKPKAGSIANNLDFDQEQGGISSNESERLLHQLHLCQEKQETFLNELKLSKRSVEIQRERARRLQSRIPEYWDISSLEVKSTPIPEVTEWKIKNIYINDKLIEELRLETRLDGGLAGLLLAREPDESNEREWIRWPDAFQYSEMLPVIPTNGGIYQGNNAVLSSLGTTDWFNLCSLVKNMTQALSDHDDPRFHIDVERTSLSNGLASLCQTLRDWPLILRYDQIELVDVETVVGYQRIGLNLTNLSLGDYKWPLLDYRISTADQNGEFGQNPRLEFLESTSDAFENWFFEHDELRGPRLELRFAQPSAMDTSVWAALTHKDKSLVAAIINTLPIQLATIQKTDPLASLRWENWHNMANSMREILRNTLAHHN
jgi:hypothetical protein